MKLHISIAFLGKHWFGYSMARRHPHIHVAWSSFNSLSEHTSRPHKRRKLFPNEKIKTLFVKRKKKPFLFSFFNPHSILTVCAKQKLWVNVLCCDYSRFQTDCNTSTPAVFYPISWELTSAFHFVSVVFPRPSIFQCKFCAFSCESNYYCSKCILNNYRRSQCTS